MDIPEYLSRARSALADGEIDLAERYFKQVLTQNPQNSDALQGLKDIEVALAKKNWSPITRGVKLLWGSLLKSVGKSDKAYKDLELVFRSAPTSVRAALVFADCAKKTGQLEAAHEAYRRILERNHTHDAALREDAEILIHLGRLDEAAKRLEHLQKLHPQDDRIAHRLRDVSAQAYAKVGVPENLKERRGAIEKKKRELPGSLELIDRLEERLESYKKNPQDKQLGVEIASEYRASGLLEEANRYLSPILDADPWFDPARREQARVWRTSGELDISVTLFEELLAADPHDQALKDEFLDARIAQLERDWKKKGEDKETQLKIERLRQERKKNRISLLRRLLEDHPEAEKERAELGELMIDQGHIDEAISILQRLLQDPAWAGKGFFLLGQCFRAQSDHSLAISQFEKSLEFFKNKGYSHVPSDDLKSVYYYLGIAKEALGDRAGAREAYGQVYAVDIQFKDVRQRYESTFK